MKLKAVHVSSVHLIKTSFFLFHCHHVVFNLVYIYIIIDIIDTNVYIMHTSVSIRSS